MMNPEKRQYAEDTIQGAAARVTISGGGWAAHSAAVETLVMALCEIYTAEQVELSYDLAVYRMNGGTFPERAITNAAAECEWCGRYVSECKCPTDRDADREAHRHDDLRICQHIGCPYGDAQ